MKVKNKKNLLSYGNKEWPFLIRILSLDLMKAVISKQLSTLEIREIERLNKYAKETYRVLLDNHESIYHTNFSGFYISKNSTFFDRQIKKYLSKNSYADVIDFCCIYLGTLDATRSSAFRWYESFVNEEVDSVLIELDDEKQDINKILCDVHTIFIRHVSGIEGYIDDIFAPVYNLGPMELSPWDDKVLELEEGMDDFFNMQSNLISFLIEWRLELLRKHLIQNYDNVVLDKLNKWMLK